MQKLIELDAVLKLLQEYPSSNTNKIIHWLPEPIDTEDLKKSILKEVEGEIDKMIEERSKLIWLSDIFWSPRLAWKASIHALQELLQKFKS